MKTSILVFSIIMTATQLSFAQNFPEEQEIIDLSKEKWEWMSDKNADALEGLFHEKSVFVHMGGSWGKEREINIIRDGGIWYKKADIHEV